MMAANTDTNAFTTSASGPSPSAPIAIPRLRSRDSSTMLSSSMSSSSPTDGRIVRFEDACVLIPDSTSSRSRGPRLITKTYTLPRFKKRRSSSLDGPSSPDDEQRMQFRVALPSFLGSPKASSSSGTVSSANGSSAPQHSHTLTPCLVHRTLAFASVLSSEPDCAIEDESSTSSEQQGQTQRSPRIDTVPASPRASSGGLALATIPLRDCCADCRAATDAALAQGPAWDVPFTRGAARLRSLSASATEGASSPGSGGGAIRPNMVRCVRGSAAAAALGTDKVCAINVDEVDMRRGGPSTDVGADSDAPGTDTDAEGSSGINFSDPPKRPWCKSASPSGRNGRPHSAIPEEDDELFPLPSPRRSPSGSPFASPAGSASCLTISSSATETAPARRSPSNSSVESLPVASPSARQIQTQTPISVPATAARPRWLAPPGANSSNSSLLGKGIFRSSSPNLLGGMPSISGRSTPTMSPDALPSVSSESPSEAYRSPSPAPSDVSASPTLCDNMAQPQPRRASPGPGSATPTRVYSPNAPPVFPAGHAPRNLAPPLTRRRVSPAPSCESFSVTSGGRASPLPGSLSGRGTIRSTTVPERSISSPGVEPGGGSKRGSLVSPSLPDISSMTISMSMSLSLNDDSDRTPPASSSRSPASSPLSQSHIRSLTRSPQTPTAISNSSSSTPPQSHAPPPRLQTQTTTSPSPTLLRVPSSPTLTRSPSKKRASFSMAKPRGIIADVLRGVGAIGGGGGAGGGGSAVGVRM